jgi:hypothetical protein
MQYCRLFLLMFNTGDCPTSTAVLTVGHFKRRFWQQLDRLRLTTIYRDRTRPNKTYIDTILLFFGQTFNCYISNLGVTPNTNSGPARGGAKSPPLPQLKLVNTR